MSADQVNTASPIEASYDVSERQGVKLAPEQLPKPAVPDPRTKPAPSVAGEGEV